MSTGDSNSQGNGLRKSVMLREISNEADDRAVQEKMKRMEKQMERLMTILHELINEQRRSSTKI